MNHGEEIDSNVLVFLIYDIGHLKTAIKRLDMNGY